MFGGEVRHSSRDEQRATLRRLFAGLRFTQYEDVQPPEVRVSPDGRLGWVVARTRARGWRQVEGGEEVPVEYVTAWVVLYERRGGRWMPIGAATSIR